MTARTPQAPHPRLPFQCLGMERTTRFHCDAQLFNVLADGLPGVIAYFDVNFVCHFVNETVEAWTGAPPSAYLNKRLGEASPDFAVGARSGVERAMAGEHAEFEMPARFAGGMIDVVRGFAYPDKDASGRVQGAFVMLLDITRERAFEAQLQAARDTAIEANRSKSRFLAAASHDLRQPLHAMTLFVGALSRRLVEGESAELIGHVDQSLRSLRYMIDTLLDMSKIEAGLVKPNLAPLALDELFATLRPGFAATARERIIKFKVGPNSGYVVADRTLLELALRNLLANAVKFTRLGGVLLGVRRRRGELGISVVDTGSGVAPERIEKIFEEFHREKMAAHGPNDGLGLGLAIAKRLTEMMGGRLVVRSRPGKGSSFTIWLREAQVVRFTPRAHALQEDWDGLRVLILDDDPLCAAAMKQEFVDHGARASAASSIPAARAALDAAGAPEAMIIDYDLGDGETGLDFVEAVRSSGANPSVVMVSGSTNPEAISALRSSGLPWLTKPVDPRALRATLLQAMTR